MRKTLAMILALGATLAYAPDARADQSCTAEAQSWAKYGPVPLPAGWDVSCTSAPKNPAWLQYAGMADWSARTVWVNPRWRGYMDDIMIHEGVHAWQSKLTAKQVRQLSRELRLPAITADTNSALETHAAVTAKCVLGKSFGPYQFTRMTCQRSEDWLAIAQKREAIRWVQ